MSQHSLANAIWRKSSLSGNGGADCVEVAANLPGIAAVRDSKDPLGPALVFSPDGWRTFIEGVKDGEFDRLG
ncbi:DUF397 domain-containing protein [Streptosporangium sp. NBC_01755]|uniref:DUF397 domain-containing protein n=1 Tax=unclassified Streptosporangium TaxID=2632669 RepID=UPI002DDC571D|nr:MULTISPECIES: DUF397 domain-containing protein [unclassified Streptosporangium]WSA24840.1 DUF397 domain-containing protein [Streptosporangium sp. NBC_01810]WSD03977.1 DUF397 domain-containing protein [Streptosporangium sp. NBC_01755]